MAPLRDEAEQSHQLRLPVYRPQRVDELYERVGGSRCLRLVRAHFRA